MSRECGDCTLCCKIERIVEFDKPSNTWCEHCKDGCALFNKPERPEVCRTFRCLWLDNPDTPEWMRPDKVGFYAVEKGEYTKVVVDPDRDTGINRLLVEYLVGGDKHMLVVTGHQLNFFCGKGKAMPQRLQIDWIF